MSVRWSLAAALLAASCSTGPDAPPAYDPVPLARAEAIPPELVPAFEALDQALRDGDELVARSILENVYARRPEGRALELARSFERILDGRELARDLDLRLVAEESPERAGEYTVRLVASHRREEEVRLRPGAARLHQALVSVRPDGSEQRGAASRAVPELDELEIAPGEELTIPLARIELPSPPDTLAQRARISLELLPGEARIGDRTLPAQQVDVRPADCVRIASFLPATAVEPAELLRYLLEERVHLPALMERAVRIDPARRSEALDLLASRADELSLPALEDLAPALRWLSGTSVPGGDPEAWRSWLVARGERRAGTEASAARLDVPSARGEER